MSDGITVNGMTNDAFSLENEIPKVVANGSSVKISVVNCNDNIQPKIVANGNNVENSMVNGNGNTQRPALNRNFSVHGAIVSFHNLCYTVQVPPTGGKACSQKVSKEILHSVR